MSPSPIRTGRRSFCIAVVCFYSHLIGVAIGLYSATGGGGGVALGHQRVLQVNPSQHSVMHWKEGIATRYALFVVVIYRPETERHSHYFEAFLSEQFDALIHIVSAPCHSYFSSREAGWVFWVCCVGCLWSVRPVSSRPVPSRCGQRCSSRARLF